jgi:hypothetical protein
MVVGRYAERRMGVAYWQAAENLLLRSRRDVEAEKEGVYTFGFSHTCTGTPLWEWIQAQSPEFDVAAPTDADVTDDGDGV